MSIYSAGLDDIVVGETAIANVEGNRGRLSYRGYSIADLGKRPFVHVAWLLLFGEIPSAQQEQQLAHYLMAHRELTVNEIALLKAVPKGTHPMRMLQGLIPLLDTTVREPYAFPIATEDSYRGLIVAAKIPSLISAYRHRELERHLPSPNRHTDPIRSFLKSLYHKEPEEIQVETLNCVQILQMEHGYNAGTFAGRVALSTNTPVESSIAVSIGTLYGNLHGGADQAALEMAEQIACPDRAFDYVSTCLEKGERIMGMGHREYRKIDPRARILKPLAKKLCTDTESARLLATLEAVETACIEILNASGRQLHANVEFYKGAVFHALGLPSHYFTAMFAMARCYGYIAHALEFRPQSRLIRPAARYIGEQKD